MQKFKFSHFNICVTNINGRDEVRIINNLNRSIIDISTQDYELLKNNPDELMNRPDCSDALKTLIELGFVVPNSLDEHKVGEEWFRQVNTDRDVFQATILTTYMCNLACPYCVEEGVKEHNEMDTVCAASVASWIQQSLEKDHCKKLKLTFYGGEPLLNLPALLSISRQLNKYCENNNIKFSNHIISNGVKLTRDVALNLRVAGVSSVKVTLDGYKDVHDRYRKTLGGRGSFDTIMKNIRQVQDVIDLQIGCNYDEGNYESVKELLMYLKSEGMHRKLKEVSIKPIMSTLGQKYGADSACSACAMSDQDMEKIAAINEFAYRLGFQVRDRSKVGPCPALTYHNYIVDPDGKIYKCPGFVGHKEHAIGNIWSGVADVKDAFRNLKLEDKCKTCKYLPTCAGGCRYGAYVQNGDTDKILCEQKYMEVASPRFIAMQ